MAVDEATDARLPFGMGDIDLMSTSAVFAIVSLILGFAVFSMTESIGSYVASRANSTLGNYLGFNPGSGQSSEPFSV